MLKVNIIPLSVVAIAALSAIPLQPAAADEFSQNGFIMPSKNIYCVVYDEYLRCEIQSQLKPMPPQPASCNLDWGNGFVLTKNGNTEVLCAGDTIYSPNFPVLQYGKLWTKAGFVCESSTNGLTCINSQGNGFFLSREEWHIL
ncbi:MAG TPA: hypothetical protein DEG17_20040 [Cyanobacteria bacterium UBA11149]|nr:hypothetical protein [Cyanobacteria bacterium UBA11367]HBE57259.1 hypothetical protein [Cyanobacteria bacterium UBA11366]HBR73636.1 hypothetical protein [Cyanobacteria bacterium UBA11159]HBS69195.1 hypothetical protein [Cyanobacteria bacterium UBA11153]HBW91089.1 hypothetical protein [Cyanobacteria bacterium UBA11149]HCA96549.1 hypothetical protein [Cyanobacteria bacterium UBA9226]